MKFGKIVAIAVVVIALGVIYGLVSTKPKGDRTSTSTDSSTSATANAPQETIRPVPIPKPIVDKTQQSVSIVQRPGPAPQPKTNGIPDWEEKIENILTSEIPDNEKAKKMLELFPQLSSEAQEEVAHHLSNLVPDEEYAPLGNYLTNSALPEAVLEVLLEDVFNRPNSLKLPILLAVARDSQHPKASEAKDVLELFLEEDYGNDWAKWQAKMDVWLKDNPD